MRDTVAFLVLADPAILFWLLIIVAAIALKRVIVRAIKERESNRGKT